MPSHLQLIRHVLAGAILTVLLAGAAPSPAQTARPAETARGTVWLDRNANGLRDRNERGIAGVKVSNGRDVVKTDRQGRYVIPLPTESILYITKPAAYNVPVNAANLPQFYYIHYPTGTPDIAAWSFPVIEPTGPLPQAIDFALLPGQVEPAFRALAFADPQTATDEHLDMMRKDIIDPLVGNPHDASFAVVAGDVVNDNLALYERHNRLMAQLGVPIWNVPGNHDLNFDAPDATYSTETYRSIFGPDYYSFDYGRIHVLALNNVDWRGRGNGYRGFLSEKQLAWIANDLRDVPRDNLIVVLTHIPLITDADGDGSAERPRREGTNTVNLPALLELLAPFKRVYGIAGHDTSNSWKFEVNHAHGWHGYPFIAHTLAEVRGNGWERGPRDDRGVRAATMQDGNPNGYYVMTFDGAEVTPRFFPANTPAGRRMRVTLDPALVRPDGVSDVMLDRGRLTPGAKAVVNLYDGGARDRITVSIDGAEPVAMTHVLRTDPYMEAMYRAHEGGPDAFSRPTVSSHIWEVDLPPRLAPGIHVLRFESVDEFGLTASESFTFEILP
jgi:hypothetical protein